MMHDHPYANIVHDRFGLGREMRAPFESTVLVRAPCACRILKRLIRLKSPNRAAQIE